MNYFYSMITMSCILVNGTMYYFHFVSCAFNCIVQLNGVVVVYEAILRDSSNVLLSSMNTTNILTHTLGGIAPNGSVTFTGLVPNTMFTVQSRAYTAFNSSTFAHAGNLSSLFPVMTPITS